LVQRLVHIGSSAEHVSPGGCMLSPPLSVSATPGHDGPQAGLHNIEQVNTWRQTSDAVHARGGLVLAVLSARSPSLPALLNDPDVMDRWVRDFRNAAENAVDAGFDGVELSADAGSLAEQLLLGLPPSEAVACVGDLLRALATAWPAACMGLRLSTRSASTVALPALLADARELGVAYLHVAGTVSDDGPTWRRLWAGPLWVSGLAGAAQAEAGIAAGHFDVAVLDRGAGF
jgi:NADH:flavin oxidoreductase / NADH oxidase family